MVFAEMGPAYRKAWWVGPGGRGLTSPGKRQKRLEGEDGMERKGCRERREERGHGDRGADERRRAGVGRAHY